MPWPWAGALGRRQPRGPHTPPSGCSQLCLLRAVGSSSAERTRRTWGPPVRPPPPPLRTCRPRLLHRRGSAPAPRAPPGGSSELGSPHNRGGVRKPGPATPPDLLATHHPETRGPSAATPPCSPLSLHPFSPGSSRDHTLLPQGLGTCLVHGPPTSLLAPSFWDAGSCVFCVLCPQGSALTHLLHYHTSPIRLFWGPQTWVELRYSRGSQRYSDGNRCLATGGEWPGAGDRHRPGHRELWAPLVIHGSPRDPTGYECWCLRSSLSPPGDKGLSPASL